MQPTTGKILHDAIKSQDKLKVNKTRSRGLKEAATAVTDSQIHEQARYKTINCFIVGKIQLTNILYLILQAPTEQLVDDTITSQYEMKMRKPRARKSDAADTESQLHEHANYIYELLDNLICLMD